MKKTLFSAMCALFLCSGMSAKVIYVTTDGNDNNAGTSWETAVMIFILLQVPTFSIHLL